MKPSQADIQSFVQKLNAKQAEIAALPKPTTRIPTQSAAQSPARNEPELRKNEPQPIGGSTNTPSPSVGDLVHPVAAPSVKRKRKGKPAAMKSEYRIEVNTTLARRDKIERVATALGVSMSTYLLLCEENAVHDLVERFAGYLETRTLVAEEKFNLLASQLAAALRNGGNISE
jgi:hypothetical protein